MELKLPGVDEVIWSHGRWASTSNTGAILSYSVKQAGLTTGWGFHIYILPLLNTKEAPQCVLPTEL